VLSLRAGLAGVDSEVIIVDNGSAGTAAPAVWPGPGLQVVHLTENRGFAAAANRGAALARGRAILFLNSDVELAAKSGARLLRALESDSRLATVAACAACPDESRRYPGLRFLTPFNHAAALLGLRQRRCLPGPKQSATTGVAMDSGLPTPMVVRRDVFAAAGGFDEGFFFYEEDEDLCWRLARRGYRSAVAENVIVKDLGGASAELAKRINDWPTVELYTGQLRFVRRRFGRPGVAAYKLSMSCALALKIAAAVLRVRRRAMREYLLVLRSLWIVPVRLVTKAA
jgi:GT2 family glycosyltransferase